MITQSKILPHHELFTAYLQSVNDPKGPGSFYTFGRIDHKVVRASGQTIHYTPVDNSNGFWQIASTAYSVNGEIFSRVNNTAIMDTGTTLALVDDQTCETIYSQIPGAKLDKTQGGYVFPVDTPLSCLPVVEFDIGGKMFQINPEDLAFAPIGNGTTYAGVQSRGDLPFDILGDMMLKNIYAIFDMGRMRFGCVQRNDSPYGTSDYARMEHQNYSSIVRP